MSDQIVFARNGQALTTSEIIAQGVGIEHRALIQSIRKYQSDFETFGTVSFETRGANGTRNYSVFAFLNEQQATLLVTYCKNTEIVRKFKVALVKAFYEMRTKLLDQTRDNASRVATLTPAQQLLVRQAVASRAKIESKNYQTIYRAIYNRFQIARYDQLPQTDLNECLKFIQEVNLNTPEVKHHSEPAVQGQVLLLTHEDCERLRNFIYAFKYLFRKEVEMFYEFLYRVKSPYAGKFYDATTDWSLTNVEQILEKCGYPVKELDCYKHWSSHN